MSKERAQDPAAQIRRDLSKRSVETGENLTFVLERFAAQRLLYRLSVSEHRNRFVLKGAALLAIWSEKPYRATRDIDLLGWGENSAAGLRGVFLDLCGVQAQDGLVFDPESLKVEEIRESQEYGGFRVKLRAYLGEAWVNVQVDIGFGDAVTPEAVEVEYPSMLDLPPAKLRAYPRETVVAEKLEAMVRLGLINSRMKDFSDLHYLSAEFAFDGRLLCAAVKATFARRQTILPEGVPVALTERFHGDAVTRRRWSGFLNTARMKDDISLTDVCTGLTEFIVPVLASVASGEDFEQTWPPGGPWRKEPSNQ